MANFLYHIYETGNEHFFPSDGRRKCTFSVSANADLHMPTGLDRGEPAEPAAGCQHVEGGLQGGQPVLRGQGISYLLHTSYTADNISFLN
jgi:hypothetical protein